MHHQPKLAASVSIGNPACESRDQERTSRRMNRVAGSATVLDKDDIVAARLRGARSSGPDASLHSSDTDNLPAQIRTPKSYASEIFGVDRSTSEELRTLLKYLRRQLPPMDKQGPMSGKCIPETDQMEDFLKRNFGFYNNGQYIVSGVRAFELRKPLSKMESNARIYFPHEHRGSFTMTVSEIRRWQNSFAVYADKSISGTDKVFLYKALQGKSKDGDEAFRMKFVVRISDCPILMKFDAKILPRSLDEYWPNNIKLVSVTGIDFAGRQHDAKDITTYITNWEKVFELDRTTGMPAVFHGRDFRPLKRHPPVVLDEQRLVNDLICMVRTRLRACDIEGVQIVVETGIGLGVFAGKHIGIDGQVRMLSAYAVRYVLQNEWSVYKNIRAIVFALPIFSRTLDGHQLPDTYHDFVNEFRESKYRGPIPVLIADQDMHELTVAIALQGFRVSQLNPADSHGVFGEYWQNHGPAVEEKLALTTVGLLVQHHLINPSVLDHSKYHFI
ncbi:unnamed protein product [Rotaria sp. Silwood2]|nr:unnamed protein product [Rotaria sp. Silwood2]